MLASKRGRGVGRLSGRASRLMIKRLQVQVLAGVIGNFLTPISISWSFCQNRRRQVAAKHMHPTYVASNEVTLQSGAWFMAYTEHTPRWQQFHMARAT